MTSKSRNVGIQVRHARACPANPPPTAKCKSSPSYRAEAWDARAGKKLRETFPTLAAAKAWRADAIGGVRRGTMRATDSVTVTAAANACGSTAPRPARSAPAAATCISPLRCVATGPRSSSACCLSSGR